MWLFFPPIALAADSWSEPHAGMRLLRRTTSDPLVISALEVDLCARGVSLRATKEDERQDQVSDFAESVGAQAAINGDFFSYDDYYVSGMAMGAGALWDDDNTSEGFVAFGGDHAWISPPSEDWGESPDDWMSEIVAGRPQLVVEGVAGTSFSDPSHCDDLHPRTAVGLSRDRRTLWFVVVDGRSDESEGMTCPDLADLLVDLGAWDALNLDGGGSSTLWVEGDGVVNDPSDGSERVVANHLAVLADGTGPAASCDATMDEAIHDAGAFDPGHTDVDGDGLADLCARAAASFRCHASSTGEAWTIDGLSNDAGFADEANWSTIRMADLDGDGLADVCARGDDGVSCWKSTGAGFGEAIAGPTLSDGSGWGDPEHFPTLRAGDVDGDGDDDLCARAAAGVLCWTSPDFARVDGPTLSDDSGWSVPWHSDTLALGDVDGDGDDDACARAGAGMMCWLAPDFATRIDGPAWTNAAGWDDVAYWSTIRLRDVDGDGRADLCGRGPDGIACALSDGAGFPVEIAGPALSDDSGWGDHDNYATIRWGDVDADGDADVCARANARVYCWLQDAGAFASRVDGPELSDASGWSDPRYYTTMRLADVDGDRDDDLCARAAAGMRCWLAPDFAAQVEGPTWSDDSGWDEPEYYATIRAGTPPPRAPDDTGEPAGDTGDAPDGGPPSATVDRAEEGTCGCGGGSAAWVALLALRWRRCAPPRSSPTARPARSRPPTSS
ncbi:MAG: phosphodiester glycosidase family protein [Myxococcota bacterium]